jgi:dUTP pyrophosphatase
MDFATLYIYVNAENQELRELYKTHIRNHNLQNQSMEPFPNSGFDLFVPETVDFLSTDDGKCTMVNFQVKMEMRYQNHFCAYYSYPRSSISKTPLILANHVGVIDSGYRGNLMGAFRCLSSNGFSLEKHTRILQICHPSLCKIHVIMVEQDKDLSSTVRGEGGFGSTGTKGNIKV